AIAILCATVAWWRLISGNPERGFLVALVAGMANAVAVYTVLPRIQDLAVAPRLVAASRAAPCKPVEPASLGHPRPNPLFLGRTNTKLLYAPNAAEFLRAGGCRVAFIESRDERAFADRAAELNLAYTRIGQVRGYDYSNGRRVSFLVLMPKEAPQ